MVAVGGRDVPHALHHPVHGTVGIVAGVPRLPGGEEGPPRRRRPCLAAAATHAAHRARHQGPHQRAVRLQVGGRVGYQARVVQDHAAVVVAGARDVGVGVVDVDDVQPHGGAAAAGAAPAEGAHGVLQVREAPGRLHVPTAEAPDEGAVAAGTEGEGREPRGRHGARERAQEREEVRAERRVVAAAVGRRR